MKIKNISRRKKKTTVYDIETPTHDYILSNGLISHNTQETYSKTIISGGTGIQYSADWALIMGRRQVTEGTGKDKQIVGYDFIMNSDKSRFIKEKSALVYAATYENGVDPYGGLLDIALVTGHVIKPKQGWYSRPNVEDDKNWRRKETSCDEFWQPILDDPTFDQEISNIYSLSSDGDVIDSDMLEAIGEGVDPTTGEV
ncbi:MAG: hypothetical protein R3230_00580 [Nitrosopumilaceae archaeon]|nr:hypothetical protein [Nitrosopumilaceae archaeon]